MDHARKTTAIMSIRAHTIRVQKEKVRASQSDEKVVKVMMMIGEITVTFTHPAKTTSHCFSPHTSLVSD